jgi:hypothetical protein
MKQHKFLSISLLHLFPGVRILQSKLRKSTKMPIITEDETDDVLYCARTNEIEELKNFIPTLFPKYGTQPAWILSQAVDAETGNTALHYAGANGHEGNTRIIPFSTSVLTAIQQKWQHIC